MLLAHKIRLEPNTKQKIYFSKASGVSRFAYNWGLAEWKRQYEAGEKPSEAKLRRQLNSVKAEQFPWMYEVTKVAPQQAIKDLGSAFSHFFRQVKQGDKDAGYPKFKKKGINNSFRADNGSPSKGVDAIKVCGDIVNVPKLGLVKMSETVRFDGVIMSCTISKKADHWYASFTVDTDTHPNELLKERGNGIVGVDIGIKILAVLSDGSEMENPKALKSNLRKMKRLQRKLSRQKKGSKNRNKTKQEIARLHSTIHNIRIDALHKLTTELAMKYDAIVIENLSVKNMVKNHNLALALSDASFGEFRRQIEYKSEMYGCELIIADRYFPSTKTCSGCGQIHDMPLSKRVINCDCGLKMDRDLNAAMNLKKYGELHRN